MRRCLLALSLMLSLSVAEAADPAVAVPAAGFDAQLAAKTGADDYGMRRYVLVILKTGPTKVTDAAERKAMFAGHMANIQRLADEKKLVIAGPFAKPADKTWRGILIMDVTKTEEARALAATDPGVQAGEFVADAHAMRASGSMRNLLAFEEELKRETGNEPVAPGQPPKNIRAYVMITCEDFQHTSAAVSRSILRDAVVWSGQFSGTPRGVIVVDALQPEFRGQLVKAGSFLMDDWKKKVGPDVSEKVLVAFEQEKKKIN